MKKSIGLFALMAFAINVLAQEPTAPAQKEMNAPATVQKSEQKAVKEGVSFKGGKTWMNKGGKMTALDKEVTLVNGARITPSGQVIMKDGTKSMLKEGDFVMMDGTIERATPVKATDRTKAYPAKDANK